MAGNAATPIIPRDGVLVIKDNTGTPKTLTIPYRNGDLKLSGIMPGYRTVQEFTTCGKLYAVRQVEDSPIDVEFACDADHLLLGDGASVVFAETALQLGAWSGATSMLASTGGDAWVVTLQFTVERTNFGGTADNVVVLAFVVVKGLDFQEGVPSKFTFKGSAWPRKVDGTTAAITLT